MNAFGKATLAFFLAVSTVIPGYAAEITVDDNCSLRDAIGAANRDIATTGCRAGDGADVIMLTTDVQLQSALPLVNCGARDRGKRTLNCRKWDHAYLW